MATEISPEQAEQYDRWYETARGRWIADTEFELLLRLIKPARNGSLLDVGSGTAQFSRRFSNTGFDVVCLDPAPSMLRIGRHRAPELPAVSASAMALPYPDGSFDYCAAITSLCFVTDPAQALVEMWRVCRSGIILGLLNHHSLLYLQKRGRGSYKGARWDSGDDIRSWCRTLMPKPETEMASAIYFPAGGIISRTIEHRIPNSLLLGGFLAAVLRKPTV